MNKRQVSNTEFIHTCSLGQDGKGREQDWGIRSTCKHWSNTLVVLVECIIEIHGGEKEKWGTSCLPRKSGHKFLFSQHKISHLFNKIKRKWSLLFLRHQYRFNAADLRYLFPFCFVSMFRERKKIGPKLVFVTGRKKINDRKLLKGGGCKNNSFLILNGWQIRTWK